MSNIEMIKVLSLVGTRPEAVKMAPVIEELERRSDRIESVVCVTAQHREMLDQVLELFEIAPDYDLDVMSKNQTPSQVAAAIMSGLEPVLQVERPDWVLVQGDTTTVMSASLTAFHNGVNVGHVEAGLRTFDKHRPFPEEINRRTVGLLADLHFAPTTTAEANLLREGISADSIALTGNSVIDAIQLMADVPYDWPSGPLGEIPLDRRLALVTAHRRESFGRPLQNVCRALLDVAERFEDVHIAYPVHPNPHVERPVHSILGGHPRITLVPPLDYLSLVQAMKRSYLVLTDSGGIQEEAPALGKPVLVLRDETERPEGVAAGAARIAGTSRKRVRDEFTRLLVDDELYAQMSTAVNPYGDGQAARRIVDALLRVSGDKQATVAPLSAEATVRRNGMALHIHETNGATRQRAERSSTRCNSTL
jgi:UDP-N-acetylglucosamine 2-epimerase (non-hydrolysing)